MSINDTLAELYLELDRTHSPQYFRSDAFLTDPDFPDFATASNGEIRNFYRSARRSLERLIVSLHERSACFNKRIDEQQFAALVRQTVVDIHAADDTERSLKFLVEQLTKRVDKASQKFIHSLPAWTCGIERTGELTLGPVQFLTWERWLTLVDFTQTAKSNYLQDPEANAHWKEILLKAMSDRAVPAPGLASTFIGAAMACPAVLRVEINGLDMARSRKLAEILCKGALDALSLLLGQRQSFTQQALQVERLPPARIDRIVESDGYLLVPGMTLTDRIPSRSSANVKAQLREIPELIEAVSHAISGLTDPTHRHPQLASRWTTALDWYAEGQRERSDAIGLAKLGTSLDVLASGGRHSGITRLLTNLLGVSDTHVLRYRTKEATLSQMVKVIYNRGRSQILHGTRHDRMEAFENDRNAAAYLGRIALIEAAVRLKCYEGADDAESFRTMPPRPEADTLVAHN